MLEKKDKLMAIVNENPNLSCDWDAESDRIIIRHSYNKLVLRVLLMKSSLDISTSMNSYWKGIRSLKKFREVLKHFYKY